MRVLPPIEAKLPTTITHPQEAFLDLGLDGKRGTYSIKSLFFVKISIKQQRLLLDIGIEIDVAFLVTPLHYATSIIVRKSLI
jgi:hypothetical protein